MDCRTHHKMRGMLFWNKGFAVGVGVGTLGNTSDTEDYSLRFDNEYLLSSLSLVTRDVSTSHVTVSAPDITSDTEQLDRRLTPSSLSDIVTREDVFIKENNNTSVNMCLQNDTCSSINISLQDIKNCLIKASPDEFNVTVMRLKINVSNSKLVGNCTLIVTLPVDHVAHIQITRNTSCSDLIIEVNDLGEDDLNLYNVCKDSEDLFSFSNQIEAVMYLTFFEERPFLLSINISAVHTKLRPQLEINFTTDKSGYVQTPKWNGKILHPPMNSWSEIPIPNHHIVMVSFHTVDINWPYSDQCERNKLFFYKDKPLNTNLIDTICGNNQTLTSLYNISKLYIHFKCLINPRTGFRLNFSFHPLSALPQQVFGPLWNCSVPHWPDFRLHFPCNMMINCVGGEDEVDCPYYSDVCGPRLQSADGTCLHLIRTSFPESWKEASKFCEDLGLLLITVNTPAELAATRDLMRRYFKDSDYLMYGLVPASASMPYMYRNVLIGVDGIANYLLPINKTIGQSECFALNFQSDDGLIRTRTSPGCSDLWSWFFCKNPASPDDTLPQMPVVLTKYWPVGVIQCPSLHYTRTFLACDAKSECWGDSKTCSAPLQLLPPSFLCMNEIQRVPYSLVCDRHSDCSDNSDESLCIHSSCPWNKNLFECSNKQCISQHFQCDGLWQCQDGSDENNCNYQATRLTQIASSGLPPPAIIDIDLHGELRAIRPLTTTHEPLCPETHFQCPGLDIYCLPVYVRCNGVYDCPGKQDETECDTYTCPGYYRCRSSHVCLHPDHVCDGWSQCPEGDDELLCDFSCMKGCVCHGLAFTCKLKFSGSFFPDLRYLDASGSRITPKDVVKNQMIVYLSFRNCRIMVLDDMNLINLQILDLSDNYITSFSSNNFRNLINLRSLRLSNNPLASLYPTDRQDLPVLGQVVDPLSLLNPTDRHDLPVLGQVLDLDVSSVKFSTLNAMISATFPNLQKLNLSGCGVETVGGEVFTKLTKLRSIDIKGSAVNYFPPQTFTTLSKLESVYADNYKVCCPASLPERFNLQKCEAPSDEISSCDALLRSDTYRVFLSLFASLALMGNAGSFIYRVFISRKTSNLGFNVFVTNLSIADFVMGVYLAIIGIADRVYLGNYLWNDLIWRNSFVCKLAGFLCLLSSEVSAFIILLVTLDRLLVIAFPFSFLHFCKRSAWIASGIVWGVGACIAVIPLLPLTTDWNFYSQNGICIPIPIIRNYFPGKDYAFGVMIILNGFLFILITVGQVFIFCSVRVNRMTNSDTSKKTKDLTIARRLMTVVVSDFCCKFPVALLGLLAARGTPVSSEVIVALVIFIVPLNSALNPFLYTFNVMKERRRQAREARIKKYLMPLAN